MFDDDPITISLYNQETLNTREDVEALNLRKDENTRTQYEEINLKKLEMENWKKETVVFLEK